MYFNPDFYPALWVSVISMVLALAASVMGTGKARWVVQAAALVFAGAAIALLVANFAAALAPRQVKGLTPFSEAIAAEIADPNRVYNGAAVTFSSTGQTWGVSEGNRVDMNDAYFAVEYTAMGRADDGRVYRFGGSVLYRVMPGDRPIMEQVMVRDLALIEAPKNGLGRPRRICPGHQVCGLGPAGAPRVEAWRILSPELMRVPVLRPSIGILRPVGETLGAATAPQTGCEDSLGRADFGARPRRFAT
jgi:hypothetical protein